MTIPSAKRLKAAALELDAASCITIVRQKRDTPRGYVYRLSLLIRRTQPQDLEDLVAAFNVPGHIAQVSARGAPYYQLAWHGQSAVAVLEAAGPWLERRKSEAKLAIKFWQEGGMGPGGPAPDEVWAKRDKLYDQMRELKAGLVKRARIAMSPPRDLSSV